MSVLELGESAGPGHLAPGTSDSSKLAPRGSAEDEKQRAYHLASVGDLADDGARDFRFGAWGDNAMVEYGGAVFV